MQYIIERARKAHTELLGATGSPFRKIQAIMQASDNACLLLAAAAQFTQENNSHPDPDIDSILQEVRAEAMDVRRLAPLAILQVLCHVSMPYTHSFTTHYQGLCWSADALCRAECPSLLQEFDKAL